MKTNKKAIVIGTVYSLIGITNMYFGYQALKQQKRFRDLKADMDHQHQVRFAGTVSQELRDRIKATTPIPMKDLEKEKEEWLKTAKDHGYTISDDEEEAAFEW